MARIELACGEGLAEQSVLPAKLGELIAVLGEALELHRTAVDLEDDGGRREHAAYVPLVAHAREAAARLRAIAEAARRAAALTS